MQQISLPALNNRLIHPLDLLPQCLWDGRCRVVGVQAPHFLLVVSRQPARDRSDIVDGALLGLPERTGLSVVHWFDVVLKAVVDNQGAFLFGARWVYTAGTTTHAVEPLKAFIEELVEFPRGHRAVGFDGLFLAWFELAAGVGGVAGAVLDVAPSGAEVIVCAPMVASTAKVGLFLPDVKAHFKLPRIHDMPSAESAVYLTISIGVWHRLHSCGS